MLLCSKFILLEFNPFGDTTSNIDILMLLLCLCCSMRLSTIFQVVFWTCVWGLPLFVFQRHKTFHVEDATRAQHCPYIQFKRIVTIGPSKLPIFVAFIDLVPFLDSWLCGVVIFQIWRWNRSCNRWVYIVEWGNSIAVTWKVGSSTFSWLRATQHYSCNNCYTSQNSNTYRPSL